MKLNYGPISPKTPFFLHGGDYNPEQWLHIPEIIADDFRLMKLANCNTMTVGIFSWSAYESKEGFFNFEWLDIIMDRLLKNNIYAILATPSGARPAWMSHKYPEILRTLDSGIKELHGDRHNHCFTSPIYRKKVKLINTKLAERYKNHPALIMWHVSNEYEGECHCELCKQAFREWLKVKYDNDLDKLNKAWYTSFWNHTFSDWLQIDSPSSRGQSSLHAHNLDWRRFVTHQTVDFMRNEIEPLRNITPNIPITTNFTRNVPGLDYWKFDDVIDVVSWDAYPRWHNDKQRDWELASQISFDYDRNRCLKGGKPFMIMENTPSRTNWQSVPKLKKDGFHLLSSIHAVAHGSDTIQYFQWRKSRGSYEKFHGAVVDHCGHENTRVFKEVTEVGSTLKKLKDIVGTSIHPEVAIIYDWENNWSIDDCQGPLNSVKKYKETCQHHYSAFWKNGVPVDVINMDCDFTSYKLLVSPMLYMIRSKVAERIDSFVRNGGIYVATYWTGIVNENDLCFLGGFPGPLRKCLGIWDEDIDSLYPSEKNIVELTNNLEGMERSYTAKELCGIIHAESAKVLANYTSDFFAGKPALTVNSYGKGKAYYIAFRSYDNFIYDFYSKLINELQILKSLDTTLPEGVTAQQRTDGKNKYIFIMNFDNKEKQVFMPKGQYLDMITSENVYNTVSLNSYGSIVLKEL